MRKSLLVASLIALSGVLVIQTSCRKAKMNKLTTSEEDNSAAENAFDDVANNVDQSADENKMSGSAKTGSVEMDYTFTSGWSTCATVTINPPAWDTVTNTFNPTFPKTITIDFGTGCTGKDGKVRKGKIITTVTGKYRDAGTVITTTTDAYYVNDYKVEGTRTVTNNGKNSSNQTYFTISVTGGKVTTPDGKIITWESTRVRTWIEGESTRFWTKIPNTATADPNDSTFMFLDGILDDAYSVSGSGSGVNRDGIAFTVTITENLRVAFCGYKIEVTDGMVEIQPQDLKKRVVDFGDGTCDNQAVVTIGNKTKTITLHS